MARWRVGALARWRVGTWGREYGFASWAVLKTYVLRLVTTAQRRHDVMPPPRRPTFKKTPRNGYIEELATYTFELARRGDPAAFVFEPRPQGPVGRGVGEAMRDVLLQRGELGAVIDVLLKGVDHPNPRVRFECAHGLDAVADQDERCTPALVKLMDDPVPRVRWMGLHGLICDGCKGGSWQCALDVVGLVLDRISCEPSARVRRVYIRYLAASADPRAERALPELIAREPNPAKLGRLRRTTAAHVG